jgi:beta-galactosidase
MFDFASDSRSDGAIPGRNDKGMVSYDRKVFKDAYYWYQANWTKRPVLHLNSKSWSRRTVASTNVKVYTNTDQVTLFVNDVPVGLPQSGADRVVVWPNVTLQPGPNRITVVGEAISGVSSKTSLSDSATWTLVP